MKNIKFEKSLELTSNDEYQYWLENSGLVKRRETKIYHLEQGNHNRSEKVGFIKSAFYDIMSLFNK